MDEFFRHLDNLFQSGDHAEIENYLRGYLEELDATGNELMKISVLNELAGFYRGVSRYVESADCYGKALDILKRKEMQETPQYATVLLNYAGTSRLSGYLKEAVSLFLSAKKMFEDTGRSKTYEYGSTLNNLALTYQDTGAMEKADETARQSLTLMRSMGASREEVATALNNLASIRLGAGKTESAHALAAEALSMYDAGETESAHHAAAFSTMGAICFRQGKHDIAVENYEKALELTHKYFGRNIEYTTILHNIAVIYNKKGDSETAIRYQTDALDLMDRLVGPKDHRSISYRLMLDEMIRKSRERKA